MNEIPMFNDLSQTEFKAVKSCLREKSFQKGDLLFREGQQCDRVFFVRSGRVKMYRISSAGREQVLETLETGDTCACNPGRRDWFCSTTAEAVTPCTVWFLARDAYIRLVQSQPELSHALNRIFANRLQCFSALIEEVSLKDVKRRLMRFLLDMSDERSKQGKDMSRLYVPFTQEEIAHRLGAARETVSRHLSQLKRSKLIDIQSHKIIIHDKEGLKKLLS
jgi:CRP-like cAMP-binding protein